MDGMGDLLGGKKRVLVPVDHQFRVILLCNFPKKKKVMQSLSADITSLPNLSLIL